MKERYNTSEVKKMTGAKQYQLKSLESSGKMVPVERTAGMRYYSAEQVLTLKKMFDQRNEVGYFAMDCRGREVTREIEKSLSSKVLEMDLLLKKTGIENVIIMGEIFTGNIENSKLEAINYSAINKEIKTVYLWHEGFPEDLVEEFERWMAYLEVKVIWIETLERKGKGNE